MVTSAGNQTNRQMAQTGDYWNTLLVTVVDNESKFDGIVDWAFLANKFGATILVGPTSCCSNFE